MLKYLKNCFLLLIPILLWNILFLAHLPEPYQPEVFWKDIPGYIGTTENIFRITVMVLPAFLILSIKTRQQVIGLWIYNLGTIVYFLSWLVLLYAPESSWNSNVMLFMAPAYTPIFWLVGIGLIGSKSFLNIKRTSLIYISLSVLFVIFHCIHAFWVFQRI